MRLEVPNEDLTLEAIPVRGSSWAEIVAFAKTFDAYAHWEEPWEHSDWSQGIPIAEYQERVRRSGQPAQTVHEVALSVDRTRGRFGRWDASLTDLRTYLFAVWRQYHHMMVEPEDLTDLYDLLDAIRSKVSSGKRE